MTFDFLHVAMPCNGLDSYTGCLVISFSGHHEQNFLKVWDVYTYTFELPCPGSLCKRAKRLKESMADYYQGSQGGDAQKSANLVILTCTGMQILAEVVMLIRSCSLRNSHVHDWIGMTSHNIAKEL